jgi:hypothetical protein
MDCSVLNDKLDAELGKFLELMVQYSEVQKAMALSQNKTTHLLEAAVDKINMLEDRISRLENRIAMLEESKI